MVKTDLGKRNFSALIPLFVVLVVVILIGIYLHAGQSASTNPINH